MKWPTSKDQLRAKAGKTFPAATLFIAALICIAADNTTNIQPRPYLRHKNQSPTAYLSRQMPAHLVLGEVLFRSPYILGNRLAERGISCNTCHPHGAASEAVVLPENSSVGGVIDLTHASISAEAENGKPDSLRIPSLRGIRYLAPYGHDGRLWSLREFIGEIIQHPFGGSPIGSKELDALTAYVQQFDFLPNAKLTALGRLSDKANADEKSGENIFQQKGCDRCHNPQSYFTDARVWRLAGVATLSPYSLENGFKTITLLRPPRQGYLHDGMSSFAEVLPVHAAQLGVALADAEVAALLPYLRALMHEEKPVDERHISERAFEIHSWLTLITRKQQLPFAMEFLVCKTLHAEFSRFAAELKTPRDRRIYREYLQSLGRLVAGAEKSSRAVWRARIADFETEFSVHLRKFGTVD